MLNKGIESKSAWGKGGLSSHGRRSEQRLGESALRKLQNGVILEGLTEEKIIN